MRAAPFIQPVSFGPRILRAETAAIAGLALLLAPV
jgi:16S rRNA U1498 N3-methylase RsmE